MTADEAIKKMQAVKAYMISGNPIWSVTEMGEAFDMAIEALENYDGVADALNGYAELYRKLKEKYDNLKKQNQMIPCNERLPNVDEAVFVYLFGDSPYIAWHDGDDWCTEDFALEKDEEPIAWMSLPKPWEGEQND